MHCNSRSRNFQQAVELGIRHIKLASQYCKKIILYTK